MRTSPHQPMIAPIIMVLWLPRCGTDLRLTIAGQDVSNIGYFDEAEMRSDYPPASR